MRALCLLFLLNIFIHIKFKKIEDPSTRKIKTPPRSQTSQEGSFIQDYSMSTESDFEPGMPLPSVVDEPGAPVRPFMNADLAASLMARETPKESPIRLTPQNAKNYIGRNIMFRTRNTEIVKKIINVSASGESITIDHPDLKNNLVIKSRKVFVI